MSAVTLAAGQMWRPEPHLGSTRTIFAATAIFVDYEDDVGCGEHILATAEFHAWIARTGAKLEG